MFSKIGSISYLIFIALNSPVFFAGALAIWLITLPFDKKKVILQQYTCFWGSLHFWLVPTWRLKIIDRKNLKRKKTYMIVSNHQSQLDILVNFTLFAHFKIVSKKEIFQVPFIGWNMLLNNYIQLKRGDKKSIEEMIKNCEKSIDQGNSIFFYPEGSRSKDGEIKPFKLGAFSIAQKKKIPLLPILIDGTKDALPKHSLQSHGKHQITLKILPEIPYEDFADLPVEKTAEKVRNLMVKEFKSIKKEI